MSMMQYRRVVYLGAFDQGSPSEGQDPTEEPSTDGFRDFLAASERCEMARPAIWVWTLVDCRAVVHPMGKARRLAASL